MPSKRVYAEDILATDTIEMGDTEFFITDVVIDNSTNGEVHLTMHPKGVPNDWKFCVQMPKFWPMLIRRK